MRLPTAREIWGAVGVVGLVVYALGPWRWALQRVGSGLTASNSVFALLYLLLIPLGIISLVLLGLVVTRPIAVAAAAPAIETPVHFPHSPTVIVGVWLLVATLGFLAGLVVAVNSCQSSSSACIPETHLAIVALAGGSGSMVATLLAYVQHASEKRDFRLSYAPWYVVRPLLGVLLAIAVYFLIKGGLLVLGEAPTSSEVNVFGLSGLSLLVGMFSKNAVEKLREVFSTLFASQSDVRDRVGNAIMNEPFVQNLSPPDQARLLQIVKDGK